MPWTILRRSGFHSNALRWLPERWQGDVVRAPWPDVAIASIGPADIAAVAATVLTEPGHRHTALTLSGPDPLTPAEQVATLARPCTDRSATSPVRRGPTRPRLRPPRPPGSRRR